VDFLHRAAEVAEREQRQVRILNVGCGPAVEIQRFIEMHPDPGRLSFTLVDFSEETLAYTRSCMDNAARAKGKTVDIKYVHESVHDLLKRAVRPDAAADSDLFDFVYCAGLFDYLSDKVCARLLQYFVQRSREGGNIFVTNVHLNNPQIGVMEHVLEWHLIYRDERMIESVLPSPREATRIYTDGTGVNVFAEFRIPTQS
jgi:extracellular factor (EF) 3-hydroxypalmitic acid methyl ester biosynthesis protein